jgi:stringent starvation protein B
MAEISTKPYLVRALFEWCNDSGYTPYVTVLVAGDVHVPVEYVKDGEIVLNVSPLATNRLSIGNDFLEFQARFGGVARDVRVPIEFIRAIYARETGQGMAFEAPAPRSVAPAAPVPAALAPAAVPSLPAPPVSATVTPLRALPVVDTDVPPPDPPAGPGAAGERPRLTRVK